MNTKHELAATLLDKLIALLGEEAISVSDADCILYAQDVYAKSIPAGSVIRPDNSEDLAKAVSLITEAGCAVIPRGGGMSYTKGYVPVERDTVIVDMSAMNKVLEINTEDMYVKVQCGCSWQDLYEALKDSGFRTPYYGTLSGRFATVGGGLSQNAIFWGSGQHGFAVDSVISLKVALADGTLLDTGAAAQRNSEGFMRHYGPDMTGLFCGDCSALGIKTEATLRLIPKARNAGYLSVCFATFEQQAAVLSEVARQGLASECFGLDPFLQEQRMKRESIASDVKSLVGVMKSAGSVGKALKEGAKIAMAGRNFIEQESWPIHYIVEDFSPDGVKQRLAEIRRIANAHDAMEIENSIPKILHANPFGPVNNMIGPQGERWVPVHALLPHSKAVGVYQACQEVFKKHLTSIEQYDIGIGYLLSTVSNNVYVLEPVFFWPDELNELHHHAVERAHMKKIKGFNANPEARETVQQIREDLIVAMESAGGIHMQIGKTYPYKEGIAQRNFAVLQALKTELDPDNKINPGCLGL